MDTNDTTSRWDTFNRISGAASVVVAVVVAALLASCARTSAPVEPVAGANIVFTRTGEAGNASGRISLAKGLFASRLSGEKTSKAKLFAGESVYAPTFASDGKYISNVSLPGIGMQNTEGPEIVVRSRRGKRVSTWLLRTSRAIGGEFVPFGNSGTEPVLDWAGVPATDQQEWLGAPNPKGTARYIAERSAMNESLYAQNGAGGLAGVLRGSTAVLRDGSVAFVTDSQLIVAKAGASRSYDIGTTRAFDRKLLFSSYWLPVEVQIGHRQRKAYVLNMGRLVTVDLKTGSNKTLRLLERGVKVAVAPDEEWAVVTPWWNLSPKRYKSFSSLSAYLGDYSHQLPLAGYYLVNLRTGEQKHILKGKAVGTVKWFPDSKRFIARTGPKRTDLGIVDIRRPNEIKVFLHDVNQWDVWFPPGKGSRQ